MFVVQMVQEKNITLREIITVMLTLSNCVYEICTVVGFGSCQRVTLPSSLTSTKQNGCFGLASYKDVASRFPSITTSPDYVLTHVQTDCTVDENKVHFSQLVHSV